MLPIPLNLTTCCGRKWTGTAGSTHGFDPFYPDHTAPFRTYFFLNPHQTAPFLFQTIETQSILIQGRIRTDRAIYGRTIPRLKYNADSIVGHNMHTYVLNY
jgi:hypothetical protein